jgi:hypothetical protein
MRDADVRNDGRVRGGDCCERGNFTRMIHADLPDRDLIP